ncbi:ArsR/SmtB family transcription factor [Clavibacter michiganensis]|uniref:ArsR/SmtB family transcription factor n=1 Tax=Clavibacter michiganensis TaxID=28447 RepID=UPI002930D8A0|nr:helix-turn-helix transcriptional regulator [Clavibacter michiganensis]
MSDGIAHSSVDIDQACAAIAATPARLRTLRVVMDGTEVTAKSVGEALGISRNAAAYHLAGLAQAGLVGERHATHPRGSGPIVYWSARAEAIRDLRDVLFDHLS